MLKDATVAALQAGLRGALLRSSDAGYEEARKVWNGMIDKRLALIVRCTGAADVVQAVQFAREHHLLVAVRGGSHNVAGYATCDEGLVIDLSPMKGIRVVGMFADDPVMREIAEEGRRMRQADCQQARRDAAGYRLKVMPHQTIQMEYGIIGVISDTHGLMRPEALAALEGAAWIIHAGDIGSAEVLRALQEIAPIVAIRGNNDKGTWADALPETTVVEVGAGLIYVLHDVKSLGRRPQLAGFRAVIAGHSHRPQLEERDDVLFLNPGSAGPRRFKLPVSVARLYVRPDAWRAELVTLTI